MTNNYTVIIDKNTGLKTLSFRLPEKPQKLVFGIGINDVPGSSERKKINGKWKLEPHYYSWKNILKKCYSKSYLSKNPSIKADKVCKEWHLFSTFKAWALTQQSQGKKLNCCNNYYRPETCSYT